MRNAVLLALALMPAILHAQGINFEDSNWETVKAKAQQENKMIFMDGYASWCGPCKWMTKEVFTDPAVGEFYNKYFINAKYDMEKEGKALAEQLGITGYPTFAFFSSDGELIHIESGALKVEKFNNLAENVVGKTKDRWFSTIEKAYDEGLREKEMLMAYALELEGFGNEKFSEVFDIYQNTLSEAEKISKENWELLKKAAYKYGSDAHKFIIDHQRSFAEIAGATEINKFLLNVDYKQAKKEKDWDKFYESAMVLVDRYDAFDYNALNGAAWTVYENMEDRNRIKKALEWVTKSIDKNMNYYNTDTKAHLLFATDQFDEARKWAEQAIALAKKEEMNFEVTEKLLGKIKENTK